MISGWGNWKPDLSDLRPQWPESSPLPLRDVSALPEYLKNSGQDPNWLGLMETALESQLTRLRALWATRGEAREC